MGDGSSFADFMDQLDVPWALQPPDWLVGECLDSSTPDLPVLNVSAKDLSDDQSPNLQLLAGVAAGTRIELPAAPM